MADLGCGRVTQHTFPLKAAGPLPSNLLLHVGEGGESGMLGGGTASMWVLCSLPYSHIRAERMCVALALPFQPNTDMRAGAPPLWVNWRGRERISDREGREPAWELAGVTRWNWRSGRERSGSPESSEHCRWGTGPVQAASLQRGVLWRLRSLLENRHSSLSKEAPALGQMCVLILGSWSEEQHGVRQQEGLALRV